MQRSTQPSPERSGELSATEDWDCEQGGFALGRGTGISVLEHRQQAPLVEAEITLRAEGAVRSGDRRFPDPITQRLLKAAMAGAALPYPIAELAEIAKHCTEREDAASKVERRVRKSAAALLLSSRIGESFDAIITGASEKGTWVRLLLPPVEGRLERGFQGLDVGDHVRVKLIGTDVESGFIDFARD